MLAGDTYVITTLQDVAADGTTTDHLWSLREALAHAAADGQVDKDIIDLSKVSGAISLELGAVSITTDVEIAGAGADKLTIDGGGLSRLFHINSGVNVTMSGLTLTGGLSVSGGGAIYNMGDLTLDAVDVVGNSTNNGGGGVFVHAGGTLSVDNSTFHDNHATDVGTSYGGAIAGHFLIGQTLTIRNSTFSNNTAATGGAVKVQATSLSAPMIARIENSTFSGNSADSGGAFNIGRATGSLTDIQFLNTTIAYNTATAGVAGGIYKTADDITLTLHNSILAKNTASNTTYHDLHGNLVGAGSSHNIIGQVGNSGLTNDLAGNQVGNATTGLKDPLLAPLDYYGGSRKTHALLNLSPAIDKASDLLAGASDQRGHSRAHDMPTPNGLGGSSDIGAFEADDSLTLVVNNAIDRNSLTATSDDLTLREALGKSRDLAGTERIEFDEELAGTAILLSASLNELRIESDVEVAGLGTSRTTIKSGGTHRVIAVDPGVEATFRAFTVTGGGGVTEGGGIHNKGRLTLNEVAVAGNQAIWSGSASSFGGGIFTANASGRDDAALRLIDTTIDGNRATNAGGLSASIGDGGFLEIFGSTISNNIALNQTSAGAGGGMTVSGTANAPITISNSTISGNSSFHSGGIRVEGATSHVSIVQSTIYNNRANISGGIAGGLHNVSVATVVVHNSIVAGNQANNSEHRDVWGNIAGTLGDPSSNNILGMQQSTHLIAEARHSGLVDGVNGNQVGSQTALKNANLTSLLDFGGPTKTHALLPTSPAVDAGNEDKAIELDQRGFARYDHPGILASVADIGAFEYRPEFVVTTLEDANIPAGKLSLRQALLLAANNSQAETITFAPELFEAGPRTITLAYDGSDAGSEPDALKLHIIADSTHLLGPGANLLTVSGAGKTGVFSGSGQAIIEGITFADGKSAYSGGAISFVGDLTLRKSRITGNEGYYYGGGIDSYGWLHIEDSEISDNTVTVSSGGRGGGIFHRNGYVKTGNDALRISNSTISGNQVLGTSGMGGGVYVYRLNAYYGTDTLRNVTISKNSAAIGGGVTSSVSYGYGANNFIRAENSIIAGNTTLSPTTPSNVGVLTLAAGSVNNLIGYNGGTGGLTHNVNGNKILGSGESDGLQSLDFHGGSTRTHALAPNSPAVDAGNDLLASPLDQRGSTRTDVAGIGGSVTDIGAFEYQSELIVNSMADGPVGYGELTLRNAMLLAERSPGPDAIRFAPEVSGTILLTQGALYINSDVTIIGPGAYELAVDAQSKSNVFVIGDDVDVELRGLTITGGHSASYGGGIYSGGLFNDGSLTLDGCVIEGNYAHSGGGLFQIDGSLTVRNSTFADNHATGFGGGVAIANLDAATFVNTTISANAAGTFGGGLYSFGSLSTRVVNSTIAFNSAATGGGIYNTVAGMIVHNTIVANNAAADPNFLDVWGSITGTVSESSSHNIIGQAGGSGLTHSPSTTGNQVGVAPEDLKLSPLGDYGGPTPIHALLPGSLAIDGGGNGAAGSHNADQRGFERIEDGDFDGVLTVDVGAYEFSYRPSLIVDTLIDENGGTSKLSLREAIHRAAPGEVIGFADELDGGTIQLIDLGDLVIRNSVVITAQTLPNGLTIKAYDPTPSYIVDGGHDAPNGDGSRIFDIEASANGVIIAGMRLTGADVLAHGGAIRSVGASLWLRNVDVYGNSTSREGYGEYYYEEEIQKYRWIANTKGGGVYSTGDLYVYDSWFDHNEGGSPDQQLAYDTDGVSGAGEAYADDIFSTGNLYVYRTRFGGDANYTRGGVLAVNGRGPQGVEIVFDDVTMTDAKGIEIDGISGGRVDDGQENVVARITNSRFENSVGLTGRYRGLYDSDIAFDDHSIENPYGTIVVVGATLHVDNSKFSHSGQAISAVKSILEIDGSEFFNNDGAINVQDSALLIEDSIIRDNVAVDSVVLRAEHGSDVKIVRTTIRDNFTLIGVDGPSSTDGGIISFMSLTPQYGAGSLVIEDSLISGNRFASGEDDGRGTYGPAIGVEIGDRADVTYKARVLIANTTISNNVNVQGNASIGNDAGRAVHIVRSAGAIGLRGGIDAEILNSTIADNYTLGSGGAIGIFGGVHLRLENSTLSGNYARTFGGAIYATSTYDLTAYDNVPDPDHPPFRHFRLDVVNTTITNNTAGWQGGGIYADASNNIRKFPGLYVTEYNENPTVVRLLNTLISDNEALGNPNWSNFSEREVLYPFGGLAPDSSGTIADSGQTDDVWFGATTTLSDDSYYNIIGVAPIYYGPLGPLYLPIADASGLPVHGNKFGYKGAPLETRLGPLTNNGGATATHALLLPGSSTPGSPAIDAGGYLVVPVIETTSPEWNLFDPSSLKRGSQQLTRDPLSADILDDLTNDGNAWESSSVGAGLDYFATNGPVVLTFELNRDYLINELVIWSHDSAESDAKSLTLEFSTDGGQTFGSPVHLTHTHNALHEPERLSLGGARAANFVRVTITDTTASPERPAATRLGWDRYALQGFLATISAALC